MRLPRSFRTSSFRLTVLYAAILTVSGLLLFTVIAWSVNHFMAEQLDATVTNEVAEVQADSGSFDTVALKRVIDGLAIKSPGFYYLLQGPDGKVVAGNMGAIEPKTGLHRVELPARDRLSGGGVRGSGTKLADGTYLFVGVSDFNLSEVREVVARTFVIGLIMTIVLAMTGGVAISLGVLRRVESVSRASRAIMAGDLDQRIALSGSDDEFDHLSSSLNTMLDRIQNLMIGLQQVSSDIAHDLRTPLTRLRQRLELAQRREHTVEGLNAALDAAIANVDDILETFGALLRIAQIEAGSRRAGFAPVRVDEVLRELIEAYEPVVEEKGQSLQWDILSDLVVSGDRELLTLLFANLIENAIRHSPAAARLSVRAEAKAGKIFAEVNDTGPGIAAEFREKALQRFYRLETSRTTPGSGLGLSLVAAIASLHDARLTLNDNEPGLKCTIEFPRLP